jgi:hypothetical protein
VISRSAESLDLGRAGGQPHLLGVELRLHPAQHDVVDLAGVAQPEQGAALVGQQRQPQPLVVLGSARSAATAGSSWADGGASRVWMCSS